MKKVAVIGANSYIARNVIYLLQQEKCFDIALYDYQDKHADNVSRYTKVMLTDKSDADKLDLDVDMIFMFTGKTGSANGFDEYDSFIDINERSLLNLLNAYRKQNSHARIIFPSTRLVYQGKKGPQTEDAMKEFKTIYAINKYACEQYLEMYHRVYDIQYTICRICIPYGTMIPEASSYGTAEFFLSKARAGENITLYGDGSQRRTLTHIEDLCRMLLLIAQSEECANDVFNIGGEDYSLLEMANLIAEMYHVSVEFIPWPEIAEKIESGDTVFDDRKLLERVEYQRRYTFSNWCNG